MSAVCSNVNSVRLCENREIVGAHLSLRRQSLTGHCNFSIQEERQGVGLGGNGMLSNRGRSFNADRLIMIPGMVAARNG